MTTKYRSLSIIFSLISLILNIAPLAAYIIKAYLGDGVTHEKVALSMTIFVVLIMSAIAWFNKITVRSRIWVIIIGLYFVLDKFAEPLIFIGVTQIVDEWVISPLAKKFKNLYIINKAIDKR